MFLKTFSTWILIFSFAKTYSDGFKFRGISQIADAKLSKDKFHTGKYLSSFPRFAGKLFSASGNPIAYSIPDQPKRFAEAKVVSFLLKSYHQNISDSFC